MYVCVCGKVAFYIANICMPCVLERFSFFSLHFSWEIHLCGSLWLYGSVPTLTITRFSSHWKNCLLDEFLTPLEERMAVSSQSPPLLPTTAGTQDSTFPGLVLNFKEILSSGCSRFCCLCLSLSFFLTLLYIWKTHLKRRCTFFFFVPGCVSFLIPPGSISQFVDE